MFGKHYSKGVYDVVFEWDQRFIDRLNKTDFFNNLDGSLPISCSLDQKKQNGGPFQKEKKPCLLSDSESEYPFPAFLFSCKGLLLVLQQTYA